MTDSLIGIIKDALSSFEFTQKRGHYPADHWSNRAYAAIEGDASTRKDEDVAKLLKERDGGVNHPPAPSEISVVDQGLRSGLAGFLDARADALHPADDALALGLYADWALEFLAPYLRTPKTTCFYCGHGSGHADDCVRDAKAPEPVSSKDDMENQLSWYATETEKLRDALRKIREGANTQGAFTGMSWSQVN